MVVQMYVPSTSSARSFACSTMLAVILERVSEEGLARHHKSMASSMHDGGVDPLPVLMPAGDIRVDA
jgi:hypothetical protein